MIAQEINRYSAPVVKSRHRHNKPLVLAGSLNHKQLVFQRTMDTIYMNNRLDFGRQVKGKGHTGSGTIIAYAPFGDVEWDGLKCKCIEVWFPPTETILFHPSDLKLV